MIVDVWLLVGLHLACPVTAVACISKNLVKKRVNTHKAGTLGGSVILDMTAGEALQENQWAVMSEIVMNI